MTFRWVPTRWHAPHWLGRLIHLVACQPWTLIGFGIIGIAHAYAFSGFGQPIPKPPVGLELLANLAPLWVYAVLWLIAGVLCFAGAFVDSLRWWGLGCSTGMTGLWWLFYISGFFQTVIEGTPSRIYYVAALYFGLWLAVLGQIPKTDDHDEDDAEVRK